MMNKMRLIYRLPFIIHHSAFSIQHSILTP